jgi:hypothetical protein
VNSAYLETQMCINEIKNILKQHPDVYLARLELWDREGRQFHRTTLKYKDWCTKKAKEKADKILKILDEKCKCEKVSCGRI